MSTTERQVEALRQAEDETTILRCLTNAGDPVPTSEVQRVTRLPSGAVRRHLLRLREQGQVYNAGSPTRPLWARTPGRGEDRP